MPVPLPAPSPVRDNPARNRFEMDTEAGVAFANYRRDGRTLMITHTEVPRAIEGRGVGSQFVAGVLELVRSRGEKVVPLCGFVRHFIAQHPDYADLVM
jgi:predicted GNAT family acetyltransferase